METPWKKGYWFTTSMSSSMGWMEENTFSWKSMIALDYPEAKPVMTCTVKLGEFGPAHPDVVKESGKDFYNMEMEMTGFKIPMVLSDDGTKICYIGLTKNLDIVNWCDEELLSKLKEDRDPCDAPPSIYTPQPNQRGKIIWISGPPGAGKSTTAQLLGRNHGYVFYEGDAFIISANPFIDPNAEYEGWQQTKQKPLKGLSVETIKAVETGYIALMQIIQGGDTETLLPLCEDFYHELAKDVKKQWKRLGGKWAVCQAVFTRKLRDQIREDMNIGADLVFLVLNLTKEGIDKRLLARHGNDDQAGIDAANMMRNVFAGFEPAGADEKNTYNVDIDADMSIEDVMNKILKILEKL